MAGVSLTLEMRIKISLNQVFLDATTNQDTVEVEGRTVGECLRALVRMYPDLEARIFDTDGHLSALVSLHGNMLLPDQLDLQVADQDHLLILPLIYGG